jgi:hypothetical protein
MRLERRAADDGTAALAHDAADTARVDDHCAVEQHLAICGGQGGDMAEAPWQGP